MTIGLGTAKTIDSLRVIWPDNTTQKWSNIAVDTTLTLKQNEAVDSSKTFTTLRRKKHSLLRLQKTTFKNIRKIVILILITKV